MSLVMLASAGILIRLSAAWTTDVGFTYDNRVAVTTDLRLVNYDARRAAAFHDRAVAVRALPGIDAATIAHLVPFGGRVYVYGLSLPGRPVDENARPERVSVNRVYTGFFRTMGIAIVRGRDFTAADLVKGADAAIVSATMAQRFWPDGDAIGQRFSVDGPDGPFRTVVGIARDVQIDEFTERPSPAAWLYGDDPGELVILAASPRPPAQYCVRSRCASRHRCEPATLLGASGSRLRRRTSRRGARLVKASHYLRRCRAGARRPRPVWRDGLRRDAVH